MSNQKPNRGAEADAKEPIIEAARSFMELFVAESGDERFLTVEDIDHNELANRYEALELALAALAHPHPGAVKGLEHTPLFWIRLGARAMQLSARAKCGNFWESAQEEAMTAGGLSKLDKEKLYAGADASEEISKDIVGTCEDSALGYASYMGSDDDKALLAKLGVTSDWLYRCETGEPSRKETVAPVSPRSALIGGDAQEGSTDA